MQCQAIDRVVDNLEAVADLVRCVSGFAYGTADLVAEMDLNPVVVERACGRVHLVDALIARHQCSTLSNSEAQ